MYYYDIRLHAKSLDVVIILSEFIIRAGLDPNYAFRAVNLCA